MTWLGKILAVLVMVMALVWMWFTTSAFVTRTNWKTQADTYKKAYDEAKTARESEYRAYQSEKDALTRQLATAEAESRGRATQIATLEDANKKGVTQVTSLTAAIKALDVIASGLQANLQSAEDRAKTLQARNTELEDERVKNIIARETAEKERQAAERQTQQAQADKAGADRQIEELRAQLQDFRGSGGGVPGSPLLKLDRPPAPLREGTRGTVTSYRDGYVEMNIGIDAGVTVGATLDVYREGEGGRYLGTVVIDRVYPKDAVGVFRPADPRRSVRQLRPEELPKAKDVVGKIGNVGATP